MAKLSTQRQIKNILVAVAVSQITSDGALMNVIIDSIDDISTILITDVGRQVQPAFYFINRKTKGRISIEAHVILNVDWHGSPDEIVIIYSVGNGVGGVVDIQEREETNKRPWIERREVYTPA